MLEPTCDTLPKFVFRHLAERPDALAMRRKALGIWRRISWGESGREIERIAAGLMALGLGDEACIAAIGDNEPELFWAELAIQSVGRAASCLYPDISGEELRLSLLDCGARIVFAEDQEQCDKLLELADETGLRAIVYWDNRGMEGYDDPRVIALDDLRRRGDVLLAETPDCVRAAVARGNADDLAAVIYTSGTTGRPKGVMGSHRYLLDIADRWRRVLDATPGANYVSYISPAWATEQYIGLALGVSLPMVMNFPEEPETVAIDMREIGPEFLFYSPRQWEAVVAATDARIRDAAAPVRAVYRWSMQALAEGQGRQRTLGQRFRRGLADILVGRAVRDRLGFGNLHTAVNSGSTLSPEVFAFFRALGVSMRNVYGFTEIGIVAATGDDDPRDTVGRLLTSAHGAEPVQVRIHDDEIQVRGGVVFSGYFNRPEAMAERLTPDGWIRSGDAGRFDADGRLIYLDRLDDLRRLSSGETVAPQYIETRIRLSPYIRDVIVVGEGRAAVAALVDIDMELVGRWAEERQISFTSQVDLSQHAQVYALIEQELAAVNATLPETARVARFLNLFKPFDADEGELTRSRKLRRAVIERKYADLIDGLYGDAGTVSASVEIRYQDGRTRVLQGDVAVRQVGGAAPRPASAA